MAAAATAINKPSLRSAVAGGLNSGEVVGGLFESVEVVAIAMMRPSP